MRPVVSGQQLAQVSNGDPFAPPVWRAPVYHTPGWIIAAAQITRTLWAVLRFLARHPLGVLAVLGLFEAWRLVGWPGPVALALTAAVVLVVWRLRWPASFTRWVHRPAVSRWRRWQYARHWDGVMTVARLAVAHHGRVPGPRPRQGRLDRVHRPGDRPTRLRAVPRGLRRPDRQPGARVRRALVPGPHRPARPDHPGTGVKRR